MSWKRVEDEISNISMDIYTHIYKITFINQFENDAKKS